MTLPCEQTAWFITLGCEQQSVTFQAILIRNQDVIGNLEWNEAGSKRIRTITVFGFAQQHLLFGMVLHVLVYPTPALWNVNCIGTIDFTSKKQNHSSVTSPCEETAWFVTLRCEQQTVTFQAILLRNQGVIGNLEWNEAGRQRIRTITVFGFAQ